MLCSARFSSQEKLPQEIRNKTMAVDLSMMSEKNSVLDASQLHVSTPAVSAKPMLATTPSQRDSASVFPPYKEASRLLEISAVPTHIGDDDMHQPGGNLLFEEHTQRDPSPGCRRVFQVATLPRTDTVPDETRRLSNLKVTNASSV